MRGVRGAITVKKDTGREIIKATEELLAAVIRENEIREEEMVSMCFTATADLKSKYPSVAAREMGFTQVPLLNFQEMDVEGSLSRCIRLLIYINRSCPLEEINHIYLGEAKSLRPDLA
ncbi:MAG: chorismate mutase [Halanaerobiaceae bacterium]